jgi:predicted ATPase
MKPSRIEPPRIESLRVQNYRALKSLELKGLTPLTVFLGPNGSGKSTVFDVFAFLAECFQSGLRKAWDKRGRFKELRTRGAEGLITFEIKYREKREAWFSRPALQFPGFRPGHARDR